MSEPGGTSHGGWLAVTTLVLALLTPERASAAPPPRPDLVFAADPAFGMEAGVLAFESLGRVLFRYEDLLPPLPVDEAHIGAKTLAVLARGLKLFFLDGPAAEFETAAIHEIYGHGARVRDLGGKATYSFKLPFPYGALFAPGDSQPSFTTWNLPPGSRDRDLLTTAGGLEANFRTAWQIDAHVAQTGGWVHHSDLLVYAFSKFPYFSSFTSPRLETKGVLESSDDLEGYVTQLQDRFNRWRPGDRAGIARQLRASMRPRWWYPSPSTTSPVPWRIRGRLRCRAPPSFPLIPR